MSVAFLLKKLNNTFCISNNIQNIGFKNGKDNIMIFDVLIIGGGAAGLSAAVYAKRAALNICVLEKNRYGSGQIILSDRVDNYLGLLGVDGYTLGEQFKKHAEALQVPFKYEEAVHIQKDDNLFTITLKGGETLQSRTVIYAAGAVHRKLEVDGEGRLTGKGVSYCATCDGAFYRKKTVAVVGGGDTALSEALYLSEVCTKVYLIHRRSEFRGAASLINQIYAAENIEILTNTSVTRILGNEKVSEIMFQTGKTLSVDGIFIAVGMKPETQILANLTKLDDMGYIVAQEDGETITKGLFVAGDARTKKLRQVITAVADGANAAVSAENFLRNTK